jgi:hypothetical protein
MAHFAEIGLNNTVVRVIVVSNDVLIDADGNESEQLGVDFCRDLLGGTWLQTSYSGTIRKNFAATGYTYDDAKDAFIPPQPYLSWVLNETTCVWEAPVAQPDDDNLYIWNESTLSWDGVDDGA